MMKIRKNNNSAMVIFMTDTRNSMWPNVGGEGFYMDSGSIKYNNEIVSLKIEQLGKCKRTLQI